MPKMILRGMVVTSENDKTIVIKVERRLKHPMYRKIVKKISKYAVHDPENKYKVGDIVQFIENRPISKTKKWVVLS